MTGKPGTNLGNANAEKFNTEEERQMLFDGFCQHVEKGYSDDCFPECDARTFWRYVEKYASDLQTDRILRAVRNRQLFWEKLGTAGTGGKIRGFNSLSWKFNMANRFKWADRREDKVNVQKDGAAELAAGLLSNGGHNGEEEKEEEA